MAINRNNKNGNNIFWKTTVQCEEDWPLSDVIKSVKNSVKKIVTNKFDQDEGHDGYEIASLAVAGGTNLYTSKTKGWDGVSPATKLKPNTKTVKAAGIGGKTVYIRFRATYKKKAIGGGYDVEYENEGFDLDDGLHGFARDEAWGDNYFDDYDSKTETSAGVTNIGSNSVFMAFGISMAFIMFICMGICVGFICGFGFKHIISLKQDDSSKYGRLSNDESI